MVICDKCGKGSYEVGGQPICCHCNHKIKPTAKRAIEPISSDDEPEPDDENRPAPLPWWTPEDVRAKMEEAT